jgi:putative pyruvate formate lyase activating enzyme
VTGNVRPRLPARAAYLDAFEAGVLQERARAAVAALAECTICPRDCHADRSGAALGPVRSPRNYCGVGRRAVVASAFPHFGEEAPITGTRGSGTIFFAGCSLACVFCQNHEISCLCEGQPFDADDLATLMLRLQAQGCHNLNFVTPTHVVPQLLEALVIAVDAGLRVPLVYNCGGLEKVETLRWLTGVVDIYLPDLKLLRPETGRRLLHAPRYGEIAKAAVREMHRQTGDLVVDATGIARRGVLVRHLVMPGGLSDTAAVCRFLAEELSPDTWLNLMAQYRSAGEVADIPELLRRPTADELRGAAEAARDAGLRRVDGIGLRQPWD